MGRQLANVEDLVQGLLDSYEQLKRSLFDVGDAANALSQAVSSKRFWAYVRQLELSETTVRTAMWVSNKFPPAARVKGLSFAHHQVVAALPAKEQKKKLVEAKKTGLTPKQLRQRVITERGGTFESAPGLSGVHQRLVDQIRDRLRHLARAQRHEDLERLVVELKRALRK